MSVTICAYLCILFLKCCGRVSSILIWGLILFAVSGVLMMYFASFPIFDYSKFLRTNF